MTIWKLKVMLGLAVSIAIGLFLPMETRPQTPDYVQAKYLYDAGAEKMVFRIVDTEYHVVCYRNSDSRHADSAMSCVKY